MSITSAVEAALAVPGLPGLDLELPAALQPLREAALAWQYEGAKGLPELRLAEAEAWAEHTPEEPWLLWRARRTARRLARLPVALLPGERLPGVPRFREPAPADHAALADAEAVLATMPSFPGGDAGHFHPDWPKLFQLGIGGLAAEVAQRRAAGDDPEAFYAACAVVLTALGDFCARVGDECHQMAAELPAEAAAWSALASQARRLASAPPATFHEALHLLWMVTVACWYAEDHHLVSPGRLDQLLWPFYQADCAAGRLTPQAALELLEALYIQINRICGAGLAVAVMVGGRDAAGEVVANELTYLCLAARLASRLVYPTVALAWHAELPDELMDFSLRMLASGIGDPAFFNDDLITAALGDHGVGPEDAHLYMNSTCVEIKVAGASNIWVTQPYLNLPQALLEVMKAVAERRQPEPESYDALAERVRLELAARIREAAERMDAIWRARAVHGGFPLASCLTADCLARGLDFDRGGARYNWVENSFVGLANLADGLVAVRHLVYERREFSLTELAGILAADFRGRERLRQRILHTLPKYGNDHPEPDTIAAELAEFVTAASEANLVGDHRYVPGFFCWIMHERLGSQTGATPDGRLAGTPLADGAGAAQGRELAGPTASALSTTSWSHRAALGGLVHNVKFGGSLLQTQRDRQALRHVIETYLAHGGFEIQINVVGRATLLDAQAHPERHPDLLVRVAGYSDYFVKLNPSMQDEVIARTEHRH